MVYTEFIVVTKLYIYRLKGVFFTSCAHRKITNCKTRRNNSVYDDDDRSKICST